MARRQIAMNAGTWIYEADNTIAHNADSFMNLGIESGPLQCRPLINFANIAHPRLILSANLWVYCSAVPARIAIDGYKVNKAYSALWCWDVGWGTAGCNQVTEDRSGVKMISAADVQYAGWNALPIADLTELLAMLDGNDTILLVGDDTVATIEKSPAPYLEIVTRNPSSSGMF